MEMGRPGRGDRVMGGLKGTREEGRKVRKEESGKEEERKERKDDSL